jgi:hypothetical protein
MRGSHTLLAAQKPPVSTLHLLLRLLQAVALSASPAGVQLAILKDAFVEAVSQGSLGVGVMDSQQQQLDGDEGAGCSMLEEMMQVHTLKGCWLETTKYTRHCCWLMWFVGCSNSKPPSYVVHCADLPRRSRPPYQAAQSSRALHPTPAMLHQPYYPC